MLGPESLVFHWNSGERSVATPLECLFRNDSRIPQEAAAAWMRLGRSFPRSKVVPPDIGKGSVRAWSHHGSGMLVEIESRDSLNI